MYVSMHLSNDLVARIDAAVATRKAALGPRMPQPKPKKRKLTEAEREEAKKIAERRGKEAANAWIIAKQTEGLPPPRPPGRPGGTLSRRLLIEEALVRVFPEISESPSPKTGLTPAPSGRNRKAKTTVGPT